MGWEFCNCSIIIIIIIIMIMIIIIMITLVHSYLRVYKIFTIKLLKKKLITIFKSLLETLICPFLFINY